MNLITEETMNIFILQNIFTARKRSLQRYCFHRCLCVHSGGLCPGRGVSVQGGGSLSREGGLCPGGVSVRGSLSREGGLYPGGGGLCQGDPSRTVKSGRYASYWNAFLSQEILLLGCSFVDSLRKSDICSFQTIQISFVVWTNTPEQ